MDFLGELIGPLVNGVALLGDLQIWVLVLIGVLFGVFAGAMPGIGTTLAYGLVLPFTFVMPPVEAISFLLAISVAIQYGNSIPAILMQVPGTPAAVLTAIDGFALHKRGESGLALGISFWAALVGQLISIPFFVLLVVPLSGLAYVFLAPELFSLYLFGMVAIVSLTGKNIFKGLAAAAFGLSLAFVGLDPINATERIVPVPEMRNGLNTGAVVIGLLAVSELFRQARQTFKWEALGTEFSARFPSIAQIRSVTLPVFGGAVIGTLMGAVPGAGATPAALIAYQQAQVWSKRPEEFGKGSIEGIAANESSQNASNAGELIPTLGLGIPGSGSMVLLLTALQIQGLIPGPLMIRETPELLYAAVAGMLAATIFLLATGWWMARLMLRAVTINRQLVIIVALATVVLGVFSLQFRIIDVVVCIMMGFVGYFMTRYGYSTAAAALAVVLATGFEQQLRRGLNLFDNDPITFLSRPITLVIVAGSLVFLIVGIRRTLRFQREERLAREQADADAAAAQG